MPNDGLISNLAGGACVEVPCLVDGLGIHPMAVQGPAVRAVLAGSRKAAKYAVKIDQLTAAVLPLADIDAMFDEMWEANRERLALYS